MYMTYFGDYLFHMISNRMVNTHQVYLQIFY